MHSRYSLAEDVAKPRKVTGPTVGPQRSASEMGCIFEVSYDSHMDPFQTPHEPISLPHEAI